MQTCTLLSIKTGMHGGLQILLQSIHNNADLEKEILMKTETVMAEARRAKRRLDPFLYGCRVASRAGGQSL